MSNLINNSSTDCSSSGSDDNDETLTSNEYTPEQKIVSAVWMHERHINNQTFEDIKNNFLIRFNMQAPESKTIAKWESKLFTEGSIPFIRREARPPRRLMHVPYVKASFREKPNLTITERASQLGLTKHILRAIMRHDLKESDIKLPQTKNDGSDNIADNITSSKTDR